MLLLFGNRSFVIGRAVFWDINKKAPVMWFTFDYLADLIYVCDTIVHCHEGTYLTLDASNETLMFALLINILLQPPFNNLPYYFVSFSFDF